jgi:hypothetical protein
MSRIDDRLGAAFGSKDDSPPPSRDLFARVLADIDDDRRRRRHLRRVVALWGTGALVAIATVIVLVQRQRNGAPAMPWWSLEILTTLALIGIALWLGPFIKRFGRAYAADVFHDNPLTGKSYIVLTDIVYYLIFTAYITFTAQLSPDKTWSDLHPITGITAEQVGFELRRIGGILLIIGILHGLNIVLMPVLGRLFSLNRRLPHP